MSQTIKLDNGMASIGKEAAIFDLGFAVLRFERRNCDWVRGIHTIKCKATASPGLIGDYQIDPAIEECCLQILIKLSVLEVLLK